jgi:hypothetical protein
VQSDALRALEDAALEVVREEETPTAELVDVEIEHIAREVLRRYWQRWLIDDPEVARYVAYWGVIDLVQSMVDDARGGLPMREHRGPSAT